MKPQVYVDPRPAEHFARFHARARRAPAGWTYEATRVVLTPYLLLLHRLSCRGAGHVPTDGPMIIVPNHFSFLDHFVVACFVRRRVQFMAKSQLFRFPLELWLTGVGAFPVRRGCRDEEAFKTAHAVLARGGAVVMYAEGGRSRSGRLGRPRPGVGRLALESGVPVVPAAIVGSERARKWTRLLFPRISIAYAEPLRFERVAAPTRAQSQAAAELIFGRVESLHGELVRHRAPLPIAQRVGRAAQRARALIARP